MPRIFISYRRADSKAISGRIHDHLMDAFGRENVFMDVDDIPPGVDFRAYLQNEIDKADIVLIIIGPKWASILRERRNNSQDFVRIELETALEKQKVTIPVLVEGGRMPTENDVPERVKTVFPYLNAVGVGDNPIFHRDMDRLIAALQQSDSLHPPPLLPAFTPIPPPTKTRLPLTAIGALGIAGAIIAAILLSNLGKNNLPLIPNTLMAQITSETLTPTQEQIATPTNTFSLTFTPTKTPMPTPKLIETATQTRVDPVIGSLTANANATQTRIDPVIGSLTANANATQTRIDPVVGSLTANANATQTRISQIQQTNEAWQNLNATQTATNHSPISIPQPISLPTQVSGITLTSPLANSIHTESNLTFKWQSRSLDQGERYMLQIWTLPQWPSFCSQSLISSDANEITLNFYSLTWRYPQCSFGYSEAAEPPTDKSDFSVRIYIVNISGTAVSESQTVTFQWNSN